MTSATNDDTIFPKAAPMMIPTAMSTTLPLIAKALNSCNMLIVFPLRTLTLLCLIGNQGWDPTVTYLRSAKDKECKGTSASVSVLADQLFIQQEVKREPHAEAGDITRDMRQATLVRSTGEIHVYPGDIVLDKAL